MEKIREKHMKMPQNRGDRGFTLIELLVVIVLLGILSGIAVFAVGNARDKAIAQSCRSQQAQLLKAIDLYYIDNKGTWPTAVGSPGYTADLATTGAVGVNGTPFTFPVLKDALVPTYLKEMPVYATSGTDQSAEDYVLQAVIKPNNIGSGITVNSSNYKPAWVQITAYKGTSGGTVSARYESCPVMPSGS